MVFISNVWIWNRTGCQSLSFSLVWPSSLDFSAIPLFLTASREKVRQLRCFRSVQLFFKAKEKRKRPSPSLNSYCCRLRKSHFLLFSMILERHLIYLFRISNGHEELKGFYSPTCFTVSHFMFRLQSFQSVVTTPTWLDLWFFYFILFFLRRTPRDGGDAPDFYLKDKMTFASVPCNEFYILAGIYYYSVEADCEFYFLSSTP